MNNEISLRSENGLSFEQMQKMAGVLLKSGFLPQSIRTPEQAITIMMTGKELGLGLMESLRSINVIQGKPTMSAQLLLGLCYRTKEVEQAYFEKETATEAVFVLKRKGNQPMRGVFTIEDAKRMGYAGKDNWVKQPATMLKWRAISAACRLAFPDAISGVYEITEMQDSVIEIEQPKEQVVNGKPADESNCDIPDDQLGNWVMPGGKYAGRRLVEIVGEVTDTGKAKGMEYLEWVVENAKDERQKEIIRRFLEIVNKQ